ncbi:MAG: EFR1 family ferrodoxin [bacterium]
MKRLPEHAAFYYFSGTGNSYRAACWMAEACRLNGVSSGVTPIQLASPSEELPINGNSLAVLITPTHGFTTPWLMLKFALRMPRRSGAQAIIVGTRGGIKIGWFYLPGLEGTSCYLLALILAMKRYNVRGVMGLDMPVNWTAVHPGFSEQSARAITARAHVRLDAFMKTILSGRRYLTGAVPFLFGLLLLPVSLGYLLMGRFWLAKLFFASHRCTGCGICAAGCPAQAIRMHGPGALRPYWTFACENCMRCMNTCPERAIEASYSFAAASYYITTIPVWITLLNWAGAQRPELASFINHWPQAVLQYAYAITSVALSYIVFRLLTSIPLLGRLFAITTPTYYYRRYHEPDTRLKDLR